MLAEAAEKVAQQNRHADNEEEEEEEEGILSSVQPPVPPVSAYSGDSSSGGIQPADSILGGGSKPSEIDEGCRKPAYAANALAFIL